MPVLKRIRGGDYKVESFEVNATQIINWESGSTSVDGISINKATQPPENYPIGTLDQGILNESGVYSYPLFKSIQHYFYDRSGSFTDLAGYYPSSSVWIVSVASGYFGEGIKPNTFDISLDSVSDTISDDGTGKLRHNKTGSVVGNLFYSHGIGVISENASGVTSIDSTGMQLKSGADMTIEFQSTMTIYEHTVICNVKPNEFNITINPSAFVTAENGDTYNQYILSGSELPYTTTIGLFNDTNECLAVAKLSKPIIRQRYTDQTFIVKFDE